MLTSVKGRRLHLLESEDWIDGHDLLHFCGIIVLRMLKILTTQGFKVNRRSFKRAGGERACFSSLRQPWTLVNGIEYIVVVTQGTLALK